MQRFYRVEGPAKERCFYVATETPLTQAELQILRWLLAETFEPEKFSADSLLNGDSHVVEIGPRLNFETAFSTNAVGISRSCGLKQVVRLERSRRYMLPEGVPPERFIREHHDRMTECPYPAPLATFESGLVPEPVFTVPLLEEGVDALRRINREMGFGMDPWDIDFYYRLFTERFRRNPTNVECFQLAQANSEHSRHWFFRGCLTIDGQPVPETLLGIIKSTLSANPANSVIAFRDNSSAIRGFEILTILPAQPGRHSQFQAARVPYDLIFTAETHNFPSGVAPFPGAETGTGGRIRDVHATGRGSLVVAGTAGYGVGSLLLANFPIPGEEAGSAYPGNLASPLQILIQESNGASDYGNKFGEPLIQGFVRSFGQRLPGGDRREWIKPIMFTGGVGQIDNRHVEKGKPEPGMCIVEIGGPAYRIGIGGGAASSMIQGENREELDFSAVQRGDAEMEQKMNRVIRACVEMGERNPIISIHDQGAGGPCNVLTELVEPVGGRIEIRNIAVGDKTMSVLEIWGAEYQERTALLIRPERLPELLEVARREKVNCEVLGKVTGDGRIIVHDELDDTNPVDLELAPVLSNIPQKSFQLSRVPQARRPLELPQDLTVEEALRLVFRLPSVGSKGYLVHKVDRCVTGLIARQQCCGPLQLPVADVSLIAQSHFGRSGAAVSIGEQPLKGLVDAKAGARMAVAEAVTNMVWARITELSDIKCSVNWMWAAKLPGEGALLYDAADALRDAMISLGIAADGGKDSLSMAARVGEEVVKAPGQVVVSAYASVTDVTRVVTPDLKEPGKSRLMLIDLAPGRRRLGGSALAQAFSQIGDKSPDLEDPALLKRAFYAVQQLIDEDLILAGHDCSDGGLITTLAEMVMAGNCGARVRLTGTEDRFAALFSEEAGLVIEYLPGNERRILDILEAHRCPSKVLGESRVERTVEIFDDDELCLDLPTVRLLEWWEAISDRLEVQQTDPRCAAEQAASHDRAGRSYHLTFEPLPTPAVLLERKDKPKVAIMREEGSNGDREMTSAFFAAGFEPWDVTMTDLLQSDARLDDFRGVAFVGGFSYADVLDSAKGWAGIIRFSPGLKEMFDAFYHRPDTFSLGVCNGCQLMALLGWIPFKGLPDTQQPRFIRNRSGRFESRWVTLQIEPSPAIMLRGMEGSRVGIWVAHGEGRLHCPDRTVLNQALDQKLAPLIYVDDHGRPAETYPFNPNGSSQGIAGFCSEDGRHFALMPHPERSFLKWQWPWMPVSWKTDVMASPWLRIFQNAREWCEGQSRT
ncbi:MAG: phosphoribosylformylglycinamidine synthase [Acidobacteria bacterium]|nr:MAG: phosphoribosylformylglycinamidine synthase [Acidobacteriota bacterium]